MLASTPQPPYSGIILFPFDKRLTAAVPRNRFPELKRNAATRPTSAELVTDTTLVEPD